jgi:hypothetical protein
MFFYFHPNYTLKSINEMLSKYFLQSWYFAILNKEQTIMNEEERISKFHCDKGMQIYQDFGLKTL